jgi:hypothetical protein
MLRATKQISEDAPDVLMAEVEEIIGPSRSPGAGFMD